MKNQSFLQKVFLLALGFFLVADGSLCAFSRRWRRGRGRNRRQTRFEQNLQRAIQQSLGQNRPQQDLQRVLRESRNQTDEQVIERRVNQFRQNLQFDLGQRPTRLLPTLAEQLFHAKRINPTGIRVGARARQDNYKGCPFWYKRIADNVVVIQPRVVQQGGLGVTSLCGLHTVINSELSCYATWVDEFLSHLNNKDANNQLFVTTELLDKTQELLQKRQRRGINVGGNNWLEHDELVEFFNNNQLCLRLNNAHSRSVILFNEGQMIQRLCLTLTNSAEQHVDCRNALREILNVRQNDRKYIDIFNRYKANDCILGMMVEAAFSPNIYDGTRMLVTDARRRIQNVRGRPHGEVFIVNPGQHWLTLFVEYMPFSGMIAIWDLDSTCCPDGITLTNKIDGRTERGVSYGQEWFLEPFAHFLEQRPQEEDNDDNDDND